MTFKEKEQRVFEDWLAENTPSGDVDTVQRLWHESIDYQLFILGNNEDDVIKTTHVDSEEVAAILGGVIVPRPSFDPRAQSVTESRVHDDCDGDKSLKNSLCVAMDFMGDMYISIGNGRMLRFRTDAGGGSSPRVRNALILLMEAMRADNEAKPHNRVDGE